MTLKLSSKLNAGEQFRLPLAVVCTENLNTGVVVMKSAQDGTVATLEERRQTVCAEFTSRNAAGRRCGDRNLGRPHRLRRQRERDRCDRQQADTAAFS
jgi:hypothetical protein